MIVGCYSLHLYCDNFDGCSDEVHGFKEFPHEMIGETFSECVAEARKKGWLIVRKKNKALCPKCSGKWNYV